MFLVHNERTKLTAIWFNTLATALIAAGFFGHMAALVYHVVPFAMEPANLIAAALGCLAFGGLLHLIGLAFLGRLRA